MRGRGWGLGVFLSAAVRQPDFLRTRPERVVGAENGRFTWQRPGGMRDGSWRGGLRENIGLAECPGGLEGVRKRAPDISHIGARLDILSTKLDSYS